MMRLLMVLSLLFVCCTNPPPQNYNGGNSKENVIKTITTYFSDSQIAQPFDVIDIVAASDLAGNLGDLIKQLKENAMKLNADAIIISISSTEANNYHRNLNAQAIKYKSK
jgi:hypothetical protein